MRPAFNDMARRESAQIFDNHGMVCRCSSTAFAVFCSLEDTRRRPRRLDAHQGSFVKARPAAPG